MVTEYKNLKDPEQRPSASYGAGSLNMSVTVSYTKTNKLITALYMVTDIMDKEEPLRNKLRTLGIEIISDIYTDPLSVCRKISEIMSFLDIALAMNIISEMNTNILRKEFLELDQSILSGQAGKEYTGKTRALKGEINLSEFLRESASPKHSREKYKSIGHQYSTRIGVQKGSTLMKALSDQTRLLSDTFGREARPNMLGLASRAISHANNLGLLKKERRDNITNIIRIIGKSVTIKDIKDKIKIIPEQAGVLVSCSEKTLQRELISMTKDGVLNKTGEKRWSRYQLGSRN